MPENKDLREKLHQKIADMKKDRIPNTKDMQLESNVLLKKVRRMRSDYAKASVVQTVIQLMEKEKAKPKEADVQVGCFHAASVNVEVSSPSLVCAYVYVNDLLNSAL